MGLLGLGISILGLLVFQGFASVACAVLATLFGLWFLLPGHGVIYLLWPIFAIAYLFSYRRRE